MRSEHVAASPPCPASPPLPPPPPPLPRAACRRPRRDLHTGTLLTSFKSCSCPPGGLSRLGRDYLVAAQLGRGGGLHFWAWHKDQPHLRCFAAEQLTCVAASPDGAWCAAGGASGAAFVWETSSGRLLKTWPAHYKVGRAAGPAVMQGPPLGPLCCPASPCQAAERACSWAAAGEALPCTKGLPRTWFATGTDQVHVGRICGTLAEARAGLLVVGPVQ